jgi:hypothetical protein
LDDLKGDGYLDTGNHKHLEYLMVLVGRSTKSSREFIKKKTKDE